MRRYNKKHRSSDPHASDSEEESPAMPPGFPDIASLLGGNKKKVFRDHNHIYFRCEVTMQRVNQLCNLIEEYNREQDTFQSECTTVVVLPKPIYLHITSMGGDLLAGLLAHDYIKNSKIPIYTIGEAYTVSSGSIMFMAGKRRFMTEHSYLLIHQLNQTNYGRETFHDMIDNASNIIEFMAKLYGIYLNNIRYNRETVCHDDILTKEKLENHMLHDIYWNVETCMKYGLVDDVYTNYNTVDFMDIHEYITRDTSDVSYPTTPTFTKDQLRPSEEVVAKIKDNLAKKVSVMDLVKQYLNKKNTMNDKDGAVNQTDAPALPQGIDIQQLMDLANDQMEQDEGDQDMEEEEEADSEQEVESEPVKKSKKRKRRGYDRAAKKAKRN